jgi:hypothetical protein
MQGGDTAVATCCFGGNAALASVGEGSIASKRRSWIFRMNRPFEWRLNKIVNFSNKYIYLNIIIYILLLLNFFLIYVLNILNL